MYRRRQALLSQQLRQLRAAFLQTPAVGAVDDVDQGLGEALK